MGARPANRPDAPASRGISHTRVLLPRSPGAAASRSWFVLQGLTTAGSTVIGFDAPVTTLASRPGPHRLPCDRFPDRLTGRVRSPRELPPLLPRHGTLRPARHRADPFGGGHLAPSSSLEVSSSLQRSRVAASTSAGPKAHRTRLLPAATFRPRRFYDLDGLLRHPLLSGFPRTALVGFDLLMGFPLREGLSVPAATFPSWCYRPALPPQSLSLAPLDAPSGVCSSGSGRSPLPNRPCPPTLGFPDAGARPP